jgi:hypothetical protein
MGKRQLARRFRIRASGELSLARFNCLSRNAIRRAHRPAHEGTLGV